jgi:hypothetical protein
MGASPRPVYITGIRRDTDMFRASKIRRALVQAAAGAAILMGGGEAAAQVAWDSPLLSPPTPRSGWGIYLIDPAGGGDVGVMGTWRGSGLLGFRIGIAEARGDDDLAVFGGLDMSGNLVSASSDFPLDISWVAGAGLGGGNDILFSVPFGVTLGRDLVGDGIRFTPYFTPRVVLDAWFGDDPPDDDLDLDFALDLGADIAFEPSWAVRFAGTIGDRDAVAIGAIFYR